MYRLLAAALLMMALLTGHAQTIHNQVDENSHKQGFWQKQLPGGILQYEGYFKDDRPVGEFKRYHPNGLLKARLFYKEGSDSVAAELFDLQGKLMAKGNYLGQEKEGRWQYFQKAQLVSEENFMHGVKSGISKTYYETGELFEEIAWESNQKSGWYRVYFKTGKPSLECRMVDGKRDGTCQVFYENGNLELDAFYEKGLRQGEWRYNHQNGEFSHNLVYNRGLLLNPEVADSIQQIRFKELERNRGKLIDPEKFMANPMQYMIKNNMP